jgi:ketopantoate reductase
LTVVARSNYDAVNADGLHITSGNHGEHHVVPFKGTKETTIICVTPADVERIVVKSVAEAGQTFDFIVCAHKAIDQESVPEQIAAGVDPSRTTIAIIQNGVGNEEPFRNRFPTTTIVSCVVSLTALLKVLDEYL